MLLLKDVRSSMVLIFFFKVDGSDKIYFSDFEAEGSNKIAKRHITDGQTFNAFGFNWSKVRTIPQKEAANMKEGKHIMKKLDLSSLEGHRIRGSSTASDVPLYQVLDGELRHIPNAETYKNLFNEPWTFDTIEQVIVDATPKGRPLVTGAYLFRVTDKVYLTDYENKTSNKTCKRHIADPPTFNRYDFNWSAIRVLSPNQVDQMEEGKVIA